MSSETSPAVKILVEAGMIPDNLLRQLVGWRLLPQGLLESSGEKKVSLSSQWDTVEDFVHNLKSALRETATEIRETDLDRVGGFKDAVLMWSDPGQGDSLSAEGQLSVDKSGCLHEKGQVFVDKFGRVVLPALPKYEKVSRVQIKGQDTAEVRAVDARYEGSEHVAWVLELKGGQDEVLSTTC